VEVDVRKPPETPPAHFVFGAQPLSEPLASVLFHRSVGLTDWTQTEVVGPPDHHPVELLHHRFCIQKGFIPFSLAADRITDADHPLLGRYGSQIGPPRFRRVATSERVSQKIKLLFRQLLIANNYGIDSGG
jgi:hypothetical protein